MHACCAHPAAALEALRVDIDQLVLAHHAGDQEVDERDRGDERRDDAEGQAQQQRSRMVRDLVAWDRGHASAPRSVETPRTARDLVSRRGPKPLGKLQSTSVT